MRRCIHCDIGLDSGWCCPQCGFSPDVEEGIPCFAPELSGSHGDYAAEHFQLLVELEANNFWFEARNHLLLWALDRFFPQVRDVMEIGVGTGFVLRAMHDWRPGARYWGSDIHLEGLRFASQRLGAGARLLQMDARRIPFRSEFDVVGLFDVLEHIDADTDVLEEVRRALKPGGGLLITVPQHMWLWSPADDAACHKRRYAVRELQRKAEAAGFEVLLRTSFMSILLPLLSAARWRSRVSKKYDIADELSLPRSVNAAFARLLAIERAAIRGGFRLLAGGSQLLVAARPARSETHG
jgi:SAM-dependent methyltransferase